MSSAATACGTALLALVLGSGAGLAGAQVQAQPEAQPAAGRAELLQQRRLVDLNHQRELQACQQRFAVTACVDEARLRRRAADEPLRQALLLRDQRARQERAAERRRVVAAKQRAAGARQQVPLPPAGPASAAEAVKR